MIPLDELLHDHRQLARRVVVREQIVERAADVDVTPAAAVRVLENARQPDIARDAIPVDRIFEITQALIVLDAGEVFLVRQRDGAWAGDTERRRQRRVEELVVRRPHERIVDDDSALKHGVLEEGPVVGDLVRDPVDDHRVVDQLVHRRSAELDVFRDDAFTASIHFLDERRRKRPLPTDNQTNPQHVYTKVLGDR